MENEIRPESVPYIVHESEMARMERVNKRWFIAWIITFILLIGCVAGFIWYEAQFEEISMTQEATTDGGGDAVVNGVASGDIYYGASETDNQSPTPQDGR